MTNLSRRILKAKEAQYTRIPGTKDATFGTWGSSQTYTHRYQISLSSKMEIINDPDGQMDIPVLIAECKQSRGVKMTCNCPGNEHHTICYHALGAIFTAYKSLSDKHISFYETYKDAINGLNFGGKLAKVESTQGEGIVWAVIRDIKPKVLNNLATNLMRGNEDDEGID